MSVAAAGLEERIKGEIASCQQVPTHNPATTAGPGGMIPVTISPDLTVPAFAACAGTRIAPKAEVSFYGNGYEAATRRSREHGRLYPNTSP